MAMVVGLSAAIVAASLGATVLTAVAWAGGTFIAVAGLGVVLLAFLWS
ncbi:hypothetical protein N7U49_19835 [Streptomyces sp. AD2-2]|nr:hypothetical protein N7U49_19835 [Streptomyces sp. AD2-2]